MMKWAFPEQDVGISGKVYKTSIRTVRDGLVNGLKHDAFLRANVYLSNNKNYPHPFQLNGEVVIVNPDKFWEQLRNRIDGYFADNPRNIAIGP